MMLSWAAWCLFFVTFLLSSIPFHDDTVQNPTSFHVTLVTVSISVHSLTNFHVFCSVSVLTECT
uniref:Uncharacterized protein n=1 Tax=Anguilla anguilla TaxID=7936 RepID=A0A0E9TIF1_ANGAN